MGNNEFLAILARVIRLHRECGIANSPYSMFKYNLTESDGILTLEFSFPHIHESVSLQHDTTVVDEVQAKLDDAQDYLDRSAVASTTAPNDND